MPRSMHGLLLTGSPPLHVMSHAVNAAAMNPNVSYNPSVSYKPQIIAEIVDRYVGQHVH